MQIHFEISVYRYWAYNDNEFPKPIWAQYVHSLLIMNKHLTKHCDLFKYIQLNQNAKKQITICLCIENVYKPWVKANSKSNKIIKSSLHFAYCITLQLCYDNLQNYVALAGVFKWLKAICWVEWNNVGSFNGGHKQLVKL